MTVCNRIHYICALLWVGACIMTLTDKVYKSKSGRIIVRQDKFKMQGLLKLFLLAGLFTISLAQCSGNFIDSANNVSINWTVIDNNTVNFIYTAPSTNTQYTALAFSNQQISQASLFVSCKKLERFNKIVSFRAVLLLMLYMLEVMGVIHLYKTGI